MVILTKSKVFGVASGDDDEAWRCHRGCWQDSAKLQGKSTRPHELTSRGGEGLAWQQKCSRD